MSTNVSNVDTLSSTLRISKKNARKAANLGMPEGNNLDRLKFGADGYAPINRFEWYGEGSGHAYSDVLPAYVALIEGDADLIFFWEGGESVGGLRIRSGVMTECEVTMTLGPESEDTGDSDDEDDDSDDETPDSE